MILSDGIEGSDLGPYSFQVRGDSFRYTGNEVTEPDLDIIHFLLAKTKNILHIFTLYDHKICTG